MVLAKCQEFVSKSSDDLRTSLCFSGVDGVARGSRWLEKFCQIPADFISPFKGSSRVFRIFKTFSFSEHKKTSAIILDKIFQNFHVHEIFLLVHFKSPTFFCHFVHSFSANKKANKKGLKKGKIHCWP